MTAVAALGFTACADDYLETSPNDSVTTGMAFATTDNCKMAVNGIAKAMTNQYLGTQGINGEGTMKLRYNEWNGNDAQRCLHTGSANYWNNLVYMKSKTATYNYYIWFYYYRLIGNANMVIDNVDNATGSEADKQFIKAQALVYRAYSYYNLVTMYSQRWCDSNNGATDGVVLRLKATDAGEEQAQPLATLGETYAQIYQDLDDAISLFQQSGKAPAKDEFYLPSLQAAYAVKARAALYREDWQTAADCAKKAREGHALMSFDDYSDGFSTPHNEWIWGVYESEDQTLYYYGYFCYLGCNSTAASNKSYPTAISKQLADQIPATDKRLSLFYVPQTDAEFKGLKATSECSNTKSDFYKRVKGDGFVYFDSKTKVCAYMQKKMRAAFMPGGGSFNLFRSAEMYYCEAEADCHLGKDSEAAQLLYEATKGYDPAYVKSTKTGAALLDEVKVYRRFDLWGEGYNWQDFKRWKQDIVREKCDPTKGLASPGSWHNSFAGTIPATETERWVWVIPLKECDYNDLINEKD